MRKYFLFLFVLTIGFASCKDEEPPPVPDYMVERFGASMSCDTIGYVRAFLPDTTIYLADTMPGVYQAFHSGDYQGSYILTEKHLGFLLEFDATPNIPLQYDLIQIGAYKIEPPFIPVLTNSGARLAYNFIPNTTASYVPLVDSPYFYVEGRSGNNRTMWACGTFDLLMKYAQEDDTIRIYGEYNLKFDDPWWRTR